MENILNNNIEINNNLELEKNQKNFLETTLGKTINTGIDIGIRAVLPDFIEEQIIDLKDNLIKYAKVSKDHDNIKVETFGVMFYEKISDAIKQIVEETFDNTIMVN